MAELAVAAPPAAAHRADQIPPAVLVWQEHTAAAAEAHLVLVLPRPMLMLAAVMVAQERMATLAAAEEAVIQPLDIGEDLDHAAVATELQLLAPILLQHQQRPTVEAAEAAQVMERRQATEVQVS